MPEPNSSRGPCRPRLTLRGELSAARGWRARQYIGLPWNRERAEEAALLRYKASALSPPT